jgi:hypothetical protein
LGGPQNFKNSFIYKPISNSSSLKYIIKKIFEPTHQLYLITKFFFSFFVPPVAAHQLPTSCTPITQKKISLSLYGYTSSSPLNTITFRFFFSLQQQQPTSCTACTQLPKKKFLSLYGYTSSSRQQSNQFNYIRFFFSLSIIYTTRDTQDFFFSLYTARDTQLSLSLNVSLFFLQFLHFSLSLKWSSEFWLLFSFSLYVLLSQSLSLSTYFSHYKFTIVNKYFIFFIFSWLQI